MTTRALTVHLQSARRLAPIVIVSVADSAAAACRSSGGSSGGQPNNTHDSEPFEWRCEWQSGRRVLSTTLSKRERQCTPAVWDTC